MAIIQNLALKSLPDLDQRLKFEAHKIWKIYSILDQARSDFLNGRLNVDEYLDLLSNSGVNVDQYLISVNQNLMLLGYDITA